MAELSFDGGVINAGVLVSYINNKVISGTYEGTGNSSKTITLLSSATETLSWVLVFPAQTEETVVGSFDGDYIEYQGINRIGLAIKGSNCTTSYQERYGQTAIEYTLLKIDDGANSFSVSAFLNESGKKYNFIAGIGEPIEITR